MCPPCSLREAIVLTGRYSATTAEIILDLGQILQMQNRVRGMAHFQSSKIKEAFDDFTNAYPILLSESYIEDNLLKRSRGRIIWLLNRRIRQQ